MASTHATKNLPKTWLAIDSVSCQLCLVLLTFWELPYSFQPHYITYDLNPNNEALPQDFSNEKEGQSPPRITRAHQMLHHPPCMRNQSAAGGAHRTCRESILTAFQSPAHHQYCLFSSWIAWANKWLVLLRVVLLLRAEFWALWSRESPGEDQKRRTFFPGFSRWVALALTGPLSCLKAPILLTSQVLRDYNTQHSKERSFLPPTDVWIWCNS